jgi:hypothetical protein
MKNKKIIANIFFIKIGFGSTRLYRPFVDNNQA